MEIDTPELPRDVLAARVCAVCNVAPVRRYPTCSRKCGAIKRERDARRQLPPVQERFERNFTKSANACWVWDASRNPKGYGSFKNPKTVTAHRVAYALYVAEIPPGLCVLHRCDNPACVRPDHLFLGTQKDNITDCVLKGRRHIPAGERNANSKLSESAATSIRSALAAGELQQTLADQYSVTPSTISRVKTGSTWLAARERES